MARVVEVDETELLRHRQLAQVVDTIMKHPQARTMVQQAHKLVDPRAQTPELDARQAVQAPLTAIGKKVDDFIAETKKEREEREKQENFRQFKVSYDSGISKLRDRGWTEDGIRGVEKLMQDKGIIDVLDAAAVFERDHPPQQPATPHAGGAWNFTSDVLDDQADIKKLLETKGQNEGLADKMARDALTEIRAQSRR